MNPWLSLAANAVLDADRIPKLHAKLAREGIEAQEWLRSWQTQPGWARSSERHLLTAQCRPMPPKM